MRTIFLYLYNMFLFSILVAPFYICIRCIFLKLKRKDFNWYRELLLFIFVLFFISLLSQTVIPNIIVRDGELVVLGNSHRTNLIPFKVFYDTYIEVFNNNNINYFLINFLGNIFIFMPIGIFVPILWNLKNRYSVLIGFLTSLFIEICQLFLNRGTDIDDLFLNTLGVYIGVIIFTFINKKYNKKIIKFR